MKREKVVEILRDAYERANLPKEEFLAEQSKLAPKIEYEPHSYYPALAGMLLGKIKFILNAIEMEGLE